MTLTASDDNAIVFETRRRDLPSPVPASWQVEELENKKVKVTIAARLDVKHDSTRDNPIKSAGQFPTGFDPSLCITAATSLVVYKPLFLLLPMQLNQQDLIGNTL